MNPPTGFFLHPAASLHDTGWGHPEHQGRLRALSSAVESDMAALHDRVVQPAAGEVGEEDLLRVHTREHLEGVRRAIESAGEGDRLVALESDTIVSGGSWEAVAGSAGAAVAAVDGVASGRLRNAFAATRPPGHHATPDRAMGFCLFNHAAVCARRLQARGAAERVLILDWDVHHGNGTQDIFYEDPTVHFLSLHQSPHYPGTGSARERGAGPGEGATLNVPLAAGTPREEYFERFAEALAESEERIDPGFVIVSAGFDVLAGDPLGGQLLEPEDMHALTTLVMEVAERRCGGRLVALLEGGYDPRRTALGALEVIRAMAGLGSRGAAG